MTAKVAPLSYASQFGYYGLRVNPSFDQALASIRKPLRIPQPDRHAKYYANSPYRALLLEAAHRANDIEGALLDYRTSGAELPELAARVHGSAAGHDNAWMHIDEDNHRLYEQQQHEEASRFLREQHHRETQAARAEGLSKMSGAWKSHPTIEAAAEELGEAGVTHPGGKEMGSTDNLGFRAQVNHYSAPVPQWAAVGQPQAPQFPSFEVLNMNQPTNLLAAKMSKETAMSYEQMRNMLPERTWDRTWRS